MGFLGYYVLLLLFLEELVYSAEDEFLDKLFSLEVSILCGAVSLAVSIRFCE